MDPPKARREGNRANEAKNGGENGLPGVAFSRSSGAVNGWAPVEMEGLSIRFLTAQFVVWIMFVTSEVHFGDL
ncbi:hypothetical protein ROHU_001913 [Labeo rohita]|uniref:Uncharacterized protein n=1 Tax=Labeo rohita TaxID=84645 RepID=A0A498P175_LABRO|nr:hypothetical protein ROHU_001913 [Labeo rohita]